MGTLNENIMKAYVGVVSEGKVRYVAPKDLPDWSKRILKDRGIKKDIEVIVGNEVSTSGNWHDANVKDVYLYDKGKVAHQKAIGGQSMFDTARENQIKKGFKTKLTPDKMILITNTYPKSAQLYVHPDAMAKMIDEPEQNITDEEYMVLVITRGLKASYMGRPLRKDTAASYGINYDTVKAQLISKGLLNRNGAINKNGRNALIAKFDSQTINDMSAAKELGFKKRGF